MKKFASILLAMILVLAMAVPAMATDTGSITITPPSGVDANATNTYKIYKVFDAVGDGTNISYKLVDGKTTAPAGFTVDKAGNVTYTDTSTTSELTAADIAAIAAYVKDDNPVATVNATGSNAVVVEGLANGYYYITTSTGTVVTIDSTNPDATVNDKNTVPTVDKKITDASSIDADGKKALAQVGTTVTFDATITVGKGAENYVLHDTMETSLSYTGVTSVKIGETDVDEPNYKVVSTDLTDGCTFEVQFDNDYIATLAEGTEIVVTYTATVISDALTTDPANNTAYISYGDSTTTNKTPTSTTEVYNAKFTVTKKDGKGNALAGAGFVIKNAEDKYYKLENNVVSWVESIDDATEYTSDDTGAVTAFTGLANGTYTLIEKTVPAGYNKAADSTFTIKEGDYTAANLIQDTTVVNNAGTELPSTGGMGTTVLYVVGGALVLAAVIILITKKRMAASK